MKLAYVVMDGGLGGHTRTSVSMAKAMRARGHDVHFFMGKGAPTKVIDDAGFPVQLLNHGFSSELESSLKALKPDAVHTFSTMGIVNILNFAADTQTPWVFTRCGGPPVREPLEQLIFKSLKIRTATCLSDENKKELLETADAKAEEILVIPARIDVDEIAELQSDSVHAAFRTKYGIDPNIPIFLRIARIGPAYRETILDGILVAERLNQEGVPVCFVHIGYADVPAIAEEIQAEAKRVNEAAGRVIAVSASEESTQAQRYLGLAQVIFGMGRSVFEGLASGRPTLVVGKVGLAGVVSEETVDRLAESNFSGRSVTGEQTRAESLQQFGDALLKILTDQTLRETLGAFALRYARERLDVGVSAPIYEALYVKYRPETMSPKGNRVKAGAFAWLKRNLRALLGKGFRSQLSALFNYRAKAK